MGKKLFPGIVWIQLPRATPSGCSGEKYTVMVPSRAASAAGVLAQKRNRSVADGFPVIIGFGLTEKKWTTAQAEARHCRGEQPTLRLNAREKAASSE